MGESTLVTLPATRAEPSTAIPVSTATARGLLTLSQRLTLSTAIILMLMEDTATESLGVTPRCLDCGDNLNQDCDCNVLSCDFVLVTRTLRIISTIINSNR